MNSVKSNESKTCRVLVRCALVAVIVAMGSARAPAQCVEDQELTASDAAQRDQFGSTVSVSENTAVVGAPGDNCVAGADCGAAYVLRFDGTSWGEEQKLTASDAASFDGFGHSVAVSGDVVFVGAPFSDCAAGLVCGAVYVFRFDGSSWMEEQKLTARDEDEPSGVGWAISASEDTVIIGAARVDCAAGTDCGAAYMFRFDGSSWVFEQKLTASDRATGDFFGYSVSIDGDTAVVGAGGDDCAAGDECGSAYMFRFDGTTWVEEQKLTASDAAAGDLFGVSSVNGETVVIGAPGDNCVSGGDCGSAYVFRFNGTSWVEEQRLSDPSSTGHRFGGDLFGGSVAVSGKTVLIGAHQHNCQNFFRVGCGIAYVFQFDGASWVELPSLFSRSYESFGYSVSLSGDTAMVGAIRVRSTWIFTSGSAYMFSCVAAPIVGSLDIKPGSCPNLVNRKANGVVTVTVVGRPHIDVSTFDLDSLTLTRLFWLDESVAPLSGPHGPRFVIEDVATPYELPTPFDGRFCRCHELGGDGIDDLSLKFSASEMSRAFGLNTVPTGVRVRLMLRGTLQDGTRIEAEDCIVPPGRDTRDLGRHHRRK